MKHAILILAHNECEHLEHLLKYFNKDCYIYIHFDKRTKLPVMFLNRLRQIPFVVNVFQEYSVHWGGYSILKAEMFLFKQALMSDASYFHILSGQDYPIRPLEDFLNLFKKYDGMEFIDYVHLPDPLWQENTFRRFTAFYFNDYIKNPRTSPIPSLLYHIQKKLGIHKNIPMCFDHLFGGSQWLSLTRETTCYLVEYTRNHPSFYRKMRFVFAPDEIYIQTVVCNHVGPQKLINSHRYVRWENENGSRPANLGNNHFKYLFCGNNIIARKFCKSHSATLINSVDKYLLHDSQLEIMSNGGWNYDGMLKYKFNLKLALILSNYTKIMKYSDGVDFGCGCGAYVAHFRTTGFPMMGYDANPYVVTLSKKFLPTTDSPCEMADLTDEYDDDVKYDIVLCLDVLTYIPSELQEKAILNLIKITQKALVITIMDDSHLMQQILMISNRHGMHNNKIVSVLVEKAYEYEAEKNMRCLVLELL